MRLVMCAAYGFAGAMIGAAVWAAIAYFGNVEVGWIAWGIGVLAGLGVAIAAGGVHGVATGGVAVVAAAAGVLVGKLSAVVLAISRFDEAQGASFLDLVAFSAQPAVFQHAFSPWDLLWFGLAMMTAFKIGAGGSTSQT